MLRLLDEVAKLAREHVAGAGAGRVGDGQGADRAGAPPPVGPAGDFIPINCGALPQEIIESELFGHVAGALHRSHAATRRGCSRSCDRGTAFLDEIARDGDRAAVAAAAVPRDRRGAARWEPTEGSARGYARSWPRPTGSAASLERGEGFRTRPLLPAGARGGRRCRRCASAATTSELAGGSLPAEWLRGRREARHAVERGAAKLKAHAWPGNVRQLKSAMRRLVLLATDGHTIEPHEVTLGEAKAPGSLFEELEQSERARVEEALQRIGRIADRGGEVARHPAHHAHQQDETLRHRVGRRTRSPKLDPRSPCYHARAR